MKQILTAPREFWFRGGRRIQEVILWSLNIYLCRESKGASRTEVKEIKRPRSRRNRKLWLHSCSQVHKRFFCPWAEGTPWWRKHYKASCEEGARGLSSPTWRTPWVCLRVMGGGRVGVAVRWMGPACFPLQFQAVLKMFPPLKSWQPDCVCRHYLPHSQEGPYSCITALTSQDKSQTNTSLELLLTTEHQRPSATWDKPQGVRARPAGSRTPTRKTSDHGFLQKATKGYVQQKDCSALYMLRGPSDFALV